MSPEQLGLSDLAVTHARVVHGDGRISPNATILIREGRIERISESIAPPAVRSVDAAGRTVIPGLIDAHVHVEDWTLPLFLDYGVTTVRDLHNRPEYIFRLAAQDAPERPRIIAAGALLDGHPSFWRNAEEVTTPADVRAAVRREVDQGARVIKAYTRIDPALMSTIVAEAKARGIPVAAHVGKSTAVEAANAGVTSIEHLSGVADAASGDPDRLRRAHDEFLGGWTAFEREWLRLDQRKLEDVAHRMIDHGVTIVPTLALHEAFSRLGDADLLRDPALEAVPESVLRNAWTPNDIIGRGKWTPGVLSDFKQALPLLQSFVKTYAMLGGRIAAGTDTAQQFVVPGASLHRELELYVEAGLTPAAALRTATRDAARLLGIGDRTGTLDTGKDADMIIVDGDPIREIASTRLIWKVIKGGVIVR